MFYLMLQNNITEGNRKKREVNDSNLQKTRH